MIIACFCDDTIKKKFVFYVSVSCFQMLFGVLLPNGQFVLEIVF